MSTIDTMKQNQKIKIIALVSVFALLLSLNLALAQSSPIDKLLEVLKNMVQIRQGSGTVQQGSGQELLFPTVPLYKPVLDYEKAVTSVVEKTSDAVVSIVISKNVPVFEQSSTSPFEGLDIPPEFQQFFQFEVPQGKQKGTEKQKIGGGSGFLVSANGLIITNKHVVDDKNAEYTVYLNDGKKYTAHVVALHPVDDLAVLKIDAFNLPYIVLGNSDDLKLGQTAIAIGNALGEFQNTVSVGVVSGLRRSITATDSSGQVEQLEGLIQTDAAINPGNSGGPLLNLRGEAIGINTAIVSGAQNIGFTIPINRARRMLQDVSGKGKIEVPYMGLYFIPVNEEIAKKYKLSVNFGAYVFSEKGDNPIIKNSPAEKAGLQKGDVIEFVDGTQIDMNNSLATLIRSKQVGQTVLLTVLRNNIEINIRAILEALPQN